jgi:hypothetical protein
MDQETRRGAESRRAENRNEIIVYGLKSVRHDWTVYGGGGYGISPGPGNENRASSALLCKVRSRKTFYLARKSITARR